MTKRWLVGVLGILLGLGWSALVMAQAPGGEGEMPPDEFMLPGRPPQPPPRGERQDRERRQDQGRAYSQKMELRHRYLERVRWEDPERYRRIVKIHDLANQYRYTDNEAKKQAILKELRPLLDNELQAQQADAKKRVSEMEKKLDNIKKILKQRDEHWNEVVDFNLKKISGQMDYLEFPPPAIPGQEPPPQAPPQPEPPKEPAKK